MIQSRHNHTTSSSSQPPNNNETTIPSLYKSITISIQQLKQYVESLSAVHASSFGENSSIDATRQSPGRHLISKIHQSMHQLEKRLPLEIPSPQARNQYTLKLQNLRDELAALTEELRNEERKQQRRRREREILLDGASATQSQPMQQHRIGQHMSLDRSLSVMEQIKDSGANVLGMLSEQNETLMHAKRKLLELGGTLGVSHRTLNQIDRRMRMDAMLVCVVMVVVTVLLVLMWWYL